MSGTGQLRRFFGVCCGSGLPPIADQCPDIVRCRSVPGADLRHAPVADYNGDGFSDILWEDNTGNLKACFMQGTTIVKMQTFGAWLPNILAERDFTIAKSLNSIFWMTFAFPCASA